MTQRYSDSSTGQAVDLDVQNPNDIGTDGQQIHFRYPGVGMQNMEAKDFRARFKPYIAPPNTQAIPQVPLGMFQRPSGAAPDGSAVPAQLRQETDADRIIAAIGDMRDAIVSELRALSMEGSNAAPAPEKGKPPAGGSQQGA